MAEIETKPERRNFGELLLRFVSGAKEKPVFSLAAFFVLAILAVAIFGTWAAPHDPLRGDPAARLQPPSSEYPMGTDALGRCLLSRVLCGAKTSVGLGFAVVVISCLVGTLVGLVAGYAGGMCDEALMRITDVFFSFPEIIAAMAIAGIAGPGTANLLLALSIVSWMRYARLVRGISLSARQRDYVEAARLSGVSHLAVIFRHILPASTPSLIVLSTIGLAKAIMAVSALGFLGFGVRPPYPEWGSLLMEGKDYILSAPHLSLYPGMAIMVSVLSFNLLGDGLRDMQDN